MKESYRGRWWEWSPRMGFAFTYEVGNHDDTRHTIHLKWFWGSLFLTLPIRGGIEGCDVPQYGVYFREDALVFCFGSKRKYLYMPWAWEWARTSALRADGNWEHAHTGRAEDFYHKKWKGILWSAQYPYVYRLKSGEIQRRTATLRVEEREWRWRWLQRLPFPRTIRKTISICFDGEVGERTGSWKGGVLSCSYMTLPDEQPLDTLRRMEREQKF